MFEITLDEWAPAARILQENVSDWWVLFSITHKLTIGFAVIGVINGVFMHETFKVATSDDNIMIRHKQRALKLHTQKMQNLFEAADESGDGLVDLEEFKVVMESPEVKIWLSAQELDVNDPERLFRLLDDG